MNLDMHPDSLNFDISAWDPRLQEFYRYWQKIGPDRKAGCIPLRSSLDPLDIPRLLANVWMVDALPDPKIKPCRFRFRLLGSAHIEMMERDLTGCYLDEVYNGLGVEDYIAVALERKISYRKGNALYHVRDGKLIERVMLPMYDDLHDHPMIFAFTIYH